MASVSRYHNSALMYRLNKLFVAKMVWKKVQRTLDAQTTYEAATYYAQWSRGKRYVSRPARCSSIAATDLANEIFLEQLIQHLTAYSTEVCRWRLGLPSIVTSGTDGLSSSRAMPSVLRRGDYAGPVFHDEAVAERQSELSTDAMVETQCQSPRTFTLERRESPHTPPDMDKGVLLKGTAVPGQLVAIYPGLMYPPLDEGETLKTENKDVWLRLGAGGGNVIDAKDYSSLQLIGIPHHPLAFGHLINHPPEGMHPNVLKFTLVIDRNFPRHLLPLIPIRWSSRPTWLLSVATPSSQAIMFAVIYVAARHVRNEELFAEVRMRPGSYPDWYTPYREENNCLTFGMAPPWSDQRDVTVVQDSPTNVDTPRG
eukprot:scpid36270/ scgid20376/ 